MIIRHPAVTSGVFRLISTVEFDLDVNGHLLPTRLELFQNSEQDDVFRCRMWERELFRLKPTPHVDESTGRAVEDDVDEDLLIERTWELSDDFEAFEAESPEAAINEVIDSLLRHLEIRPGNRPEAGRN